MRGLGCKTCEMPFYIGLFRSLFLKRQKLGIKLSFGPYNGCLKDVFKGLAILL